MILTDLAVKNRTTVAVLGLIIILLGVYSYLSLPREAFPDIPIPYILITTIYEGVSPEDVESSVTMKIEKELTGIRGVKEVTSNSAEGMSMISVEFTPDVPPDVALQRVRDRVDMAELPQEIEDPVIKEISFDEFPIMQISISGDVSPVQLKEIADRLQDATEMLPGVLKVEVLGALEREIRLEMDPDRVAQYGLTIPEIMALIPAENVNISAGSLETSGTRFNVRVPAEFVSPEEVDHLLIATRNGKPIYLADVARVRDAFKDRTSYSRLNGVENVTVSVQKRAGANIVLVSDMLRVVVARAQEQVPPAVKFDIVFDMSKYIRSTVADLENNMASGLILVVGVLLLSLGWRSSTIVSLIIPFSMLGSFFIIQALGYTLNMIVLFSLILALGMLVDTAIVIVENIYRHMQMGVPRVQAAIIGTREVAWPVTTSTLTNVASFIPLMFWPGIMGDFMKYLPLTVTIVLLTSLFVALVFNPTFCANFAVAPLRTGPEGRFIRGYRRVQHAAIAMPGLTLFFAFFLLVLMVLLYGRYGNGVEFFPQGDPERAMVDIRAPQGTNIRETDRLARLIEERIQPHRRYIEYMITNVGSSGGGFNLVASAGGPHLGNITLVFYDYAVREKPSMEVIAEIRAAVADIPGAEIRIEREKDGPPTGAPVTVRVVGEDFQVLERLSRQAQDEIASVPGLVNLRSDLEATRPELAFTVDRQRAMLLNVNTATVGNFLKTSIFGTKVGTYRQFNDEYDITVRLPLEERVNIDDLYRLMVPNMAGNAVPLSALGRFEYRGGFGTINRVDQKRVVTLTADAEGRLSTAVLADVQRRLRPLGDPHLTRRHIRDWDVLVRTLQNARAGSAPGVASRLWTVLPPKDGAALEKALSVAAADANAPGRILRLLNRALADRDLYQPQDFAGGKSPAAAQELLKRDRARLSGAEVEFLNREALEAALPGAIAPHTWLELPGEYEIRYAGEQEEQEKAQAFLGRAFTIAILMIVLILVAQFNSLLVPVIIMSTVLLSLAGVMLGLIVWDLPFGIIMTGIAVISLAGIVVNNGIVLLDFARQLQDQGLSLVDATVEAGVTRLRPVLLSAATNFIGLIPMAIGISYDFHTLSWATRSESTQWWQNMSIAIIFGLSFTTVLTLVVVPSLYVLLNRGSLRVRHALFGASETTATGVAAEPTTDLR
ncbi:MAG: efflux RND transporter permease subunit [Planctomycetes bacterium]|jgi:multidrug efflux pump subunit AcrB|nr:efflux RND transporter permease subunit [Planctomycetota bacterium]